MDSSKQNRIVNHCKILQLISKGSEQLHPIFRQRWSIYHTLNNAIIEWNDDEACGKELVKLCAPTVPKIKNLFKSGKVDRWDVTLTCSAIQAVTKELKKLGFKIDKTEDSTINILRDIRNDIMHGSKQFSFVSELSDDEFATYWNRLVKTLTKLGVDASTFEDIKILKIGQNEQSPIKPEFKLLKGKANKLFQKKQYKEAVEAYNQILEIPGLLPDVQALIFSNRSASYLLLKDYKMAQRDAEWAIQLWPSWWKGYYRLGRAQIALEEWLEAENSLNTALALDSNKEVFHELSIVRSKIGVISRHEHLNPAQQPKSLQENFEEVRSRLGFTHKQTRDLINMAKNDPLYGNIIRGHHFRDGIDVEQDYTKAAQHYAKAAALGLAEAMYNLGRLYHHGYGVPVDHEQSLYWLKKAADAIPPGGTLVGSGVPEAQHMLGLKYSEGTGVKRDFRTAAEWYEKAILNGSGDSANNLGLQYKNEQGVEKSSQKAFEYLKLASKLGDTAAMQNLAECYFAADGTGSVVPTEEDIKEGMRWLRIASEKGDLLARRELERREKLNPHETMLDSIKKLIFPGMTATSDPLDQEQYRKLVQEAAKKGSVTAQRHLDIWKNLNIAMDAFKKHDNEALVAALATALRLDHQIVEIPEVFHSVISERIKTHPNDLNAIVCNVRLNSKNYKLPEMIVGYLEMFPNDEYLLEYFIVTCISAKQTEIALASLDEVLKIYPTSSRLLYCRAIALCLSDGIKPETIKALDAFLAVVPTDHDKVPACHYRKAFQYLATKNMKKFMESYETGLAAEKEQLPCFLPYSFPQKHFLERTYLSEKIMQDKKKDDEKHTSEGPFNQSLTQILANVHRKLLIEKHRHVFISQQESKIHDKNLKFETVANLPHTPKPPRLVSLKEITLKEMNPTADKIYDGYVLEGRVLEWPFLMKGISTIIEDKNGDVERLFVYNWPLKGSMKQNFIEALKTFRPKCMVSIINPYMRMSKDMHSLIRVESPEFIRLVSSSADKQCIFCGKEAKVLPCSQCMMARYCSKECQKADWIHFDHKNICKYLKPFSNLV